MMWRKYNEANVSISLSYRIVLNFECQYRMQNAKCNRKKVEQFTSEHVMIVRILNETDKHHCQRC